MEVSSSHQMFVFVLCLLSGVLCGVFFDVQRSLRRISAAGRLRTAAEDLLFALVCTAAAIALGFLFNRGQIRYYQVMGLVSGVLFYAAFLSRITMRFLKVLYRAVHKFMIMPIARIVKVFVLPFVKMYSLAKGIFGKIKSYTAKASRIYKSKRKKLKKRMKML